MQKGEKRTQHWQNQQPGVVMDEASFVVV